MSKSTIKYDTKCRGWTAFIEYRIPNGDYDLSGVFATRGLAEAWVNEMQAKYDA